MTRHSSRSSSLDGEFHLEKYLPACKSAIAKERAEAQASTQTQTQSHIGSNAQSKMGRTSNHGATMPRGESLDSNEEAGRSKFEGQSVSVGRRRGRKISAKVSTKIKKLLNKESKDELSRPASEEKTPAKVPEKTRAMSDSPIVLPKLKFHEPMEKYDNLPDFPHSTTSRIVTNDDGRYEFENKNAVKQETFDSSNWNVVHCDSTEMFSSLKQQEAYRLSELDDFFGVVDDKPKVTDDKYVADESPNKSRYAPTREETFEYRDGEYAAVADVQRFPKYKEAEHKHQHNTNYNALVPDLDMPDPGYISREELEASGYTQQVKLEKHREKERERERAISALTGVSRKPSIQQLSQRKGDESVYDIGDWPYGENGHKESYVNTRGIPRSENHPALDNVVDNAQKEVEKAREQRRMRRQEYAKRKEELKEKSDRRRSATRNIASLEELRYRLGESTQDGARRTPFERDDDLDLEYYLALARKTVYPQEPENNRVEPAKDTAQLVPQREANADNRVAYGPSPQAPTPAPRRSRYATRDAYRQYQLDRQKSYENMKKKAALSSQGYEGLSALKTPLLPQLESMIDRDDTWSSGEHEIPEFPKPPGHGGLPRSMASINMGPEAKLKYIETHLKRREQLANSLSQLSQAFSEQPNEELKRHVADYGPISPLTEGFDKSLMPAPLRIRKKPSSIEKHVQPAVKQEMQPAIKKEETPTPQVSHWSRSSNSSDASTKVEVATPRNAPEDVTPAPATVENIIKVEEKWMVMLQKVNHDLEVYQANLEHFMRSMGVDPLEK
ncbi:hypothetical protein F5Y13DRAFT_127912 [Hypoxylon sp. FL1857]|nr:hypothetical protein F5Y13DRAFT_127912 [Hypoxylon sp. FL1857]